MSKGKRFLIVCAAVFVLGAGMTVLGIANGGAKYVRNRNVGLKDSTVTQQDIEFDSIEASGNLDITIINNSYLSNHNVPSLLDWMLYAPEGDAEGKSGKVVIVSQKGEKVPSVKTDGKKLVVEAHEKAAEAEVFVFCGDETLKSINVDSVSGDLDVYGVNFDDAAISLKAGDVCCNDIISGGIDVSNEAGNTEISGTLNGLTKVESASGDIYITTSAPISSYTMDIFTSDGDIAVGDEGYISIDDDELSTSYAHKGGDAELKLRTNAGDIEVKNE